VDWVPKREPGIPPGSLKKASGLIVPMEMGNDPDQLRLLTLRETAELLKLSRRTVMRMVMRKELPAFKVGGQWRVNESRLTKWMQGLHELYLRLN
jgi:excisionase family DNA binding protein